MPHLSLAAAVTKARELERRRLTPDALHLGLRRIAAQLLEDRDNDAVLWQLHDQAVTGLPESRAYALSYRFNHALDGLGTWRA